MSQRSQHLVGYLSITKNSPEYPKKPKYYQILLKNVLEVHWYTAINHLTQMNDQSFATVINKYIRKEMFEEYKS